MSNRRGYLETYGQIAGNEARMFNTCSEKHNHGRLETVTLLGTAYYRGCGFRGLWGLQTPWLGGGEVTDIVVVVVVVVGVGGY